MRSFVVLAVVFGAAFAAPSQHIDEVQRIKKSFGAGQVLTAPCARDSSLAPIALYLNAAEGIPHNRQAREEHKEHQEEQARSYYGGAASAAAAAALAAAGAAGAAASAGPAVGIFPGAKIGGCAVPLLLSCAPSVHSGHIAHSYAAPAAYPAAPAYRTDADHVAKMREMAPEKMRDMSSQKNWAEAERSTQMHEMPVHNWAESARAVEQAHLNAEPLGHHHHHIHGDFHMNHA